MHLTMFGGTEADVTPEDFTAVTVFGGAQFHLPTVAARVLHLKNRRERTPKTGLAGLLESHENLVVTLFGGCELREPRIADEYTALAGAIASGALGREECQALLDRVATEPALRRGCRTLTLFGGCGRGSEEVTEEYRALSALERQGVIDGRTHEILRGLVGAGVEARIRGLQAAVAAPAHSRPGVAFAAAH